MDDEEWQLMLNDCQLATPTFSDERLMQVFEEETNPNLNPDPTPTPTPNPNQCSGRASSRSRRRVGARRRSTRATYAPPCAVGRRRSSARRERRGRSR